MNADCETTKIKEEPDDNVEETWYNDEELEYPASMFLKTETECEIEEKSWNKEAFQENKASESEKEDSLTPCSESGFLASIKQKIGALFPGGIANESPIAEGPYADFVCNCGNRFSTEEEAIAHANAHTEAKPFRCLICTKHFSTKEDVLSDMKSHLSGKPDKYGCRKGFRKKNKFFSHLRAQNGKKRFQCYVCNKIFTERDDLIKHVRTHTGGTPYQCDVCKKLFWQKSYLFAHMRIHTGEKPFQCKVCKKNFTHRGNLSSHIRIHTGDKPYQCNVCNKNFTQKGNLITHMNKHTETPYQCQVCKKTFAKGSVLKNHQLTHAGNCFKEEDSE